MRTIKESQKCEEREHSMQQVDNFISLCVKVPQTVHLLTYVGRK